MLTDNSGSYTRFLLSQPYSLRYTISEIISAIFSDLLDCILSLCEGLLVSKVPHLGSPAVRRGGTQASLGDEDLIEG